MNKALLAVILSAAFAAGSPTVSALPGSDPNLLNASQEASFQQAFQSADIPAHLQILFDQNEEIYYRAYGLMKEFDRSLDEETAKGSSLKEFRRRVISEKTFGRLIALHRTNEEIRQKLIYDYTRLLDLYGSSAEGTPDSRQAEQGLNYMNRYLREAPGAARLALHPLALEMYESFPDLVELEPAYEHLLFDEAPSRIVQFMQQKHVSAELEGWVDHLKQTPTVINGKVEALADRYTQELENTARDLQAVEKYRPGTDKYGNVSGLEYPANTWSLTFDDGPLTKYSSQILKNLQDHQFKATFFELAQQAKQYPDMVRQIRAAGMEIGCHSYTHPDLTKLNTAQLNHQILDAKEVLTQIAGVPPRFFRLPYGAGLHVERVRSLIAQGQMIDVFWTIDTLDWQDHNPASILARAKKQMALARNHGGIILFHDIHPQSVVASKLLMDDLATESPKPRVMMVGEVVDALNR